MPILFSRARSPTSPRPGPRQVRSGDQPQDRKAPGLGVPPLLQQRADEVIERAHCHLRPSLLMRARAGQLFGYGTSDQSSKLTRGLGTQAAAGFRSRRGAEP
jgi:hypothetical protein